MRPPSKIRGVLVAFKFIYQPDLRSSLFVQGGGDIVLA